MAAAVLVPTWERASASGEAAAPSLAAVQVVSDAGEMRGTAALVRLEETQGGVTLYFLTSARLFRGPDGSHQRISTSVTLRLGPTLTLDVKRNDVLSEVGGLADLAILRATATDVAPFHPTPVVYGAPPVGAVFLLSGIDEAGVARTVSEHVRFESTLLVVGDGGAPSLVDCLGAPAVTADGVFGVLRECDPHRSPVISLLTLARPFLERHLAPITPSVTVPRLERR